MRYDFSARLRDDVNSAVRTTFRQAGIVNVPAVAERVRVRNLAENVALEDIEPLVLRAAQMLGAAIEFDTFANGLAWPGFALVEDGGAALDLHHSASLQ
ncbi:conserved hypothetical protein [Mesorhizobium opportunistum WSM2075]|uniref:Uncharacterized protein n=1 Tax=Mesorhizobium opportunistum (strain LMG 24607 / HAMBI 3007 / WSM2075) TaxID=536019 RepID=F7YCH8_MESOW|nr:conserved hypothetical protein [Mesorhizobium opportunistum WSM2075]